MYDSGLTAGHVEVVTTDYTERVFINTPTNTGKCYMDDDDWLDKYLSFDYKPISFYLDTGKVRIGY